MDHNVPPSVHGTVVECDRYVPVEYTARPHVASEGYSPERILPRTIKQCSGGAQLIGHLSTYLQLLAEVFNLAGILLYDDVVYEGAMREIALSERLRRVTGIDENVTEERRLDHIQRLLNASVTCLVYY